METTGDFELSKLATDMENQGIENLPASLKMKKIGFSLDFGRKKAKIRGFILLKKLKKALAIREIVLYNINTSVVESGGKWGEMVPVRRFSDMTLVFRHNLDAKNRLFIPAKFREELGTEFMIAANLHKGVNCLNVYSLDEWEKYIAPIRNIPRVEAEKVLRKLNRLAVKVSPDSQGRVLLPEQLTDFVGADADHRAMVINGCGFFAEIWTAEEYDAMIDAEDSDGIAETLLSYGL